MNKYHIFLIIVICFGGGYFIGTVIPFNKVKTNTVQDISIDNKFFNTLTSSRIFADKKMIGPYSLTRNPKILSIDTVNKYIVFSFINEIGNKEIGDEIRTTAVYDYEKDILYPMIDNPADEGTMGQTDSYSGKEFMAILDKNKVIVSYYGYENPDGESGDPGRKFISSVWAEDFKGNKLYKVFDRAFIGQIEFFEKSDGMFMQDKNFDMDNRKGITMIVFEKQLENEYGKPDYSKGSHTYFLETETGKKYYQKETGEMLLVK